jgi:hypothetical protein
MVDLSAVPLRVRLSAGSAFRLMLAIAAFGAFAYQTSRTAVLEGARGRLRTSVFALAQRSSISLREQLRPLAEAAKSQAVVAALSSNLPTAAAAAVLADLGPDTGATVATPRRSDACSNGETRPPSSTPRRSSAVERCSGRSS